MSSKVYVRTDAGRAMSMAPKVSVENVSANQASSSPIVVRAKVNSIAQTGGSKTRSLATQTPVSSKRSPSPQIARPRSRTTLSNGSSTSRLADPGQAPPVKSPILTRASSTSSSLMYPETRVRTVSAKSSLSSLAAIPSPPKSPSGKVAPHFPSGRASPLNVGGDSQAMTRVKSKVSNIVKSRPLSTIFSAPEASFNESRRTGTSLQGQSVNVAHMRPSPRAPSPLRFQSHSRRASLSNNSAYPTSQPSSPPTAYWSAIVNNEHITTPLPQSPPVSALSFTSQSSASVSVSSRLQSPVSEQHIQVAPARLEVARVPSTGSQGSGVLSSSVGSSDFDDVQDRQDTVVVGVQDDSVSFPAEQEPDEHRTTAKTNRKIADLEITNKSLLTINSNLESTKRRLTKDVHDLRRKLREARLALPPSRFRLLKSTDPDFECDLMEGNLENDDVRELVERVHGTPAEEEIEDEDEAEDIDDTKFARSLQMVQSMISAAQKALEEKIEVKGFGNNTARIQVLHVEEVEEDLELSQSRTLTAQREMRPSSREEIWEEGVTKASMKLDEHG